MKMIRLLMTACLLLPLMLGACKTTGDVVATSAVAPEDYRLRHPIALEVQPGDPNQRQQHGWLLP